MALETGHIDDPEMLDWVFQAFESFQRAPSIPEVAILDQLLATEVFDQVLATRFARKKRFGSEGADAVLPLLHALRAEAAATGVDELVMGSMHRGRFSILYNFVGMEAWRLFGGCAASTRWRTGPTCRATFPTTSAMRASRGASAAPSCPTPPTWRR